MTNIRSFKKWKITVLSVSLLLGALFAYWYIVKHPAVEIVNLTEEHQSTHTNKMSTSVLSESPAQSSDTKEGSDIPIQAKSSVQTTNVDKDAKTNLKEVTKSIDFLEMLEEQSASEHQSHLKNGTAGAGSELSQEEIYQLIREGISYYDSLLVSGSVDFFMQSSSAPDPMRLGHASEGKWIDSSEGTWQGSFEFSGNRIRGTVNQSILQHEGPNVLFPTTEEFAYDGETFENLSTFENLAKTHIGPSMQRQSDVSYNVFHDPRFWGWNMTGQGTFTELFDSLVVKNIQSVEMNDTELFHVTGTFHGAATFDTWINPEKSYRPERFMLSTPNGEGGQVRFIKDYNFQEVAPDLWFPESGQSTTTVIDAAGQETEIKTDTIRFSNVKINEHISSSRFSLNPPPGTSVYDDRSGEAFKVPMEEN
ncbi:hypothetical protein F4X73_15525 [Candidatus Poribacteria bacterium]|nr:hypothetical protein [Candidatus Poribacteria bacterium]MYB66099.1 hypothetical protein [Candidatus Poribacteria bacterium]MYF55015.1 hypothetical protein [Candidatus Poribacteria bacterium]